MEFSFANLFLASIWGIAAIIILLINKPPITIIQAITIHACLINGTICLVA